jgi:hypothetical protein
MGQGYSLRGNYFPSGQEIPRVLWNPKFITVFTTTRYLSVFWTRSIRTTLSNPALLRSVLGAFAKLRKGTISLVISISLSARLHGQTRLPLNWFSWNLIFEYFSKIYRKNLSLIKMWQEWWVLYVETYIRLCSYLAELFLKWEIFHRKFVEKFKTHYMFSNIFPRKSCRLWDNVEKCGRTRQTTDDNIIQRMRFACWVKSATDTHSEYVIFIAFPRQHCFRERASMLRLYVLACLFTFSLIYDQVFQAVAFLRVFQRNSIWIFLLCHVTHTHVRVKWKVAINFYS